MLYQVQTLTLVDAASPEDAAHKAWQISLRSTEVPVSLVNEMHDELIPQGRLHVVDAQGAIL